MSTRTASASVQSLSLVGGVVPPTLIGRIQAGEVGDRLSLSPASYHRAGSETVRDAASRAWGYLRGAWEAWREVTSTQTLPGAGTGAARERWLLPLLEELGYGRVTPTARGISVGDDVYSVSHAWQHVPVHLLGPGVDLDRRNPGVAGAARAPQSMVQELLNRSEEHLWAIVSNGLRLRLLRDSTALAGSAYVEFDLEAIFDGELYAEWLLLYQLCHVSRFEKRGGPEAAPADCWLEVWRSEAVDAGGRALDKLRGGVEDALAAIGSGFLTHPSNAWLVAALRSGEVSDREYLRALLRLVYRLLFCFVAEDRGMLLRTGQEHASARERYERFFSTMRLRRLSRVRAGSVHADLWQAQRLVLRGLGGEGIDALAVPPLGGLFDPDRRAVVPAGAPDRYDLLARAEIANADLLSAVRSLAWIQDAKGRTQRVDYQHLGAEELGSVYESLLELVPQVDLEQRIFTLQNAAGNERKTTGSYYTPPGLVSALLDTALDPVLDAAVEDAADPTEAERRLLALAVCDPACGSGGFLVAAARRIARRVAQWRSGEDEPTPEDVAHAMRDVVGRCIYGVDINDLAAELAKVSLWMEAMEPGKPLGFLDARIRVGNALLGTTPALLAKGVPDVAFRELLGDDKTVATEIRKRNKAEAGGQGLLFADSGAAGTAELVKQRRDLLAPVDDITDARAQAEAWAAYDSSTTLQDRRLHADAWCAAFTWPLHPGMPLPPTNAVLGMLEDNPRQDGLAPTVEQVRELSQEYGFFHWHLEFPEVFADVDDPEAPGGRAPEGFDCVLGNPPWERVKLEEKAYFSALSPEIADAPNASVRKGLIKKLPENHPELHAKYQADLRHLEAVSHFLARSGVYPLGGVGDVNTYAVFADLMQRIVAGSGRIGVILPSGLVSGYTYRGFVRHLLEQRRLSSFYGFENEEKIFPGVHNMTKFGLLTISGVDVREERATFVAHARRVEEIFEPQRRYNLTPAEIMAINPNTGTVPLFRQSAYASIMAQIHSAAPVIRRFGAESNPWDLQYTRMFDMANDSSRFIFDEDLRGEAGSEGSFEGVLPLYEGKMIWQYDHRYGTYEGQTQAQANKGVIPHVDDSMHNDPDYRVRPRYWVKSSVVDQQQWWSDQRRSSMVMRDIGPAERSLLVAVVPEVAAGDQAPLLDVSGTPSQKVCFCAILNSLVADFDARQRSNRIKLNVLEQIAVPAPTTLRAQVEVLGTTLEEFLSRRAHELIYVANSLRDYAEEMSDFSPPFQWEVSRRELLKAEIDAAVMHHYGLSRAQVEELLDSFDVLKKYEMRDRGEFVTRRLTLERFDAMTAAIKAGVQYETVLDPPPGEGPRHAEVV